MDESIDIEVNPADLRIDWDDPPVVAHRKVRVGGAWTRHDGKRIKIWQTRLDPDGGGIVASAGDGSIEVVGHRLEGKPRMPARAWANGVGWTDGDRFSDT